MVGAVVPGTMYGYTVLSTVAPALTIAYQYLVTSPAKISKAPLAFSHKFFPFLCATILAKIPEPDSSPKYFPGGRCQTGNVGLSTLFSAAPDI